MDQALQILCGTINRIAGILKPNEQALSLILLIGKNSKSQRSLLKQSQLEHMRIETSRPVELYYNSHGIILALDESWIPNHKITAYTLKQLNRCHKRLQISGIILCMDLHTLLIDDHNQRQIQYNTHASLLTKICKSLVAPTKISLLFTKVDVIAGFCDFFQYEHLTDLQKPLGFSIPAQLDRLTACFDAFIESLSQQILDKIHPARGSLKRTLIREFPLQMASLRVNLQHLLQALQSTNIHLDALYFTSAEQGGQSIDRINPKIQQEYALSLPSQGSQAINYRAYFIEGAFKAMQKHMAQDQITHQISLNWIIASILSTTACVLLWIIPHTFQSFAQLNLAEHALHAYQKLQNQPQKANVAVYELATATNAVDSLLKNHQPHTVTRLQYTLHKETQSQLTKNLLPPLLKAIENVMTDQHALHIARYNALKTYLMLNNPTYFSKEYVLSWVKQHLTEKSPHQLTLITRLLQSPLTSISINQRLISDTRNDLNALPIEYLYYELAKAHFATATIPLNIEGFSLATPAIPVPFTKVGFVETKQQLDQFAKTLQQESWVLSRQNSPNIPKILETAYCNEYVKWWQHFMRVSLPLHANNYQQIHELTKNLHQADAIVKLINTLQQQTKPELGENNELFNNAIASHFTVLNLMSQSAARQLTQDLAELNQFTETLSVVNDQGKTAFQFTKARFDGDHFTNPLKTLYHHASQLSEPMNLWAKQIADDTWAALINDSKNYINHQWQQIVYPEYMASIAHRYPFDHQTERDITLHDFNVFFATHGILNLFVQDYLKPFLNTTNAEWSLKELNGYIMPISSAMRQELIRANVITNMFFPAHRDKSQIQFSLQKINLDPVVSRLQLSLGNTHFTDTQTSESSTDFTWPSHNAKLILHSIEGHQYELEEFGTWAIFKLLQKVNVLVDDDNSANLHILFEVNGNSGRYLLQTQNKVNPFIPGILNDFVLSEVIV